MFRFSTSTPPCWFNDEVLPHELNLRKYLVARFSSLPDVDDVIQEAYLRLIRAHDRQRLISARAFLFTTARNIALDLVRRRRGAPISEATHDQVCESPHDHPGAPETLNRRQALELLAEAIETLPPRCRTVLKLHRLDDLPQRKVAESLGISRHTVENQVVKGMRRCADYLRARGVAGGG